MALSTAEVSGWLSEQAADVVTKISLD